MKKIAIVLALLAAPILAFAKAPARHVHIIAVRAKSIRRAHFVGDRARVLMVLPMMVDLESLKAPYIKLIQRIGMPESFVLHKGEIVNIEIVPMRGRT